MLGRPTAWLRWLLMVALAIAGARLIMLIVAPRMPEHFGWAGAIMLGLALVFLLRPFPHEALFSEPSDEDAPGSGPLGGNEPVGRA